MCAKTMCTMRLKFSRSSCFGFLVRLMQDRIGANEVEYYIGSGNKFTTAHLAKVQRCAYLNV